MSRHGTSMIKKRYESLVYETLFDTLIGDALTIKSSYMLVVRRFSPKYTRRQTNVGTRRLV
jgi:RecA/RadA recombinase